MKTRAITFTDVNVAGVLAGRKTQTRRVMNRQPRDPKKTYDEGVWSDTIDPVTRYFACPYGQAGDQLWVRESYFQLGHWEPVPGVVTRKTGRQKWRFVPDSDEVRYADDPPDAFRKGMHKETPDYRIWHKRLARFMPRDCARIWLTIVDIRVERLNAIGDADAIAEGMEWKQHDPKMPMEGYAIGAGVTNDPRLAFRGLWESIHGPESWETNPYVWVVEFERNLIFEKP